MPRLLVLCLVSALLAAVPAASAQDVLDVRSATHLRGEYLIDPAALVGRYEPGKMSLARASLRVSGDLHEHLGQLIAYARSVAVTPPWSR